MLGARAMPRCSCERERNVRAVSAKQSEFLVAFSRNRAEGLGRSSTHKVILLKGKHGCSGREQETSQRQTLTV